ncbi:efflux RND transporter periplasmic adaptor subunit [Dyella sp. EPa41]|uniref:efflux RND transporter periplasmic adaptor subunit n=1 Tax=Dyella sp. EPa41 TaxID=1561194 RepID=UPI0019165EF8|nr:efflux RND transporter periplasmic adaptor subunit [Dyella sp. EPa41]
MKHATTLTLATAALLLAAALAYWAGHRNATTAAGDHAATVAGNSSAAMVLYWYDPMLPDQHFDKPGLSPMGMQMVPKYAGGDGPAEDAVRIDPATLQNLGVRTAPVRPRVLDGEIQAPGTVTWDLRKAVTVSARVDAVIQQLDVRAPYTTVSAGAPLAELLAPAWNSALAEAEALRHVRSADAKALQGAAQQRLRVLGLSSADAHASSSDGQATITLHAPQGGVVTTLDVREGQRVSAGQTLMTINRLDTVWVEAALPQALAGRVRAGTPVGVSTDAQPGRRFAGQIETVLPDIDTATRTQRVRIVLPNPDGALSPGMFARIDFTPAPDQPVLAVPDEALVTVGDRTRVIVAERDGRFRPTPVRTGRSSQGYTEITQGLQADQRVVASGQFLIDSEASLSGALERLDSGDATPAKAASSSMDGMPMGDQR